VPNIQVLQADGTYLEVSENYPLPVAVAGAADLVHNQVALNASTATSIMALNANRRRAMVQNLGTVDTAWIGKSTVTAGNGIRLLPGQSMPVEWTGAVFGIAGSGTPSVAYWEESN
jgi:hypothetical protein